MGESTKAICALVFIVGTITAVIAWTADQPDATTWTFRIGGPTLALLALGLIFKLHFRADLAHDYLHDHAGTYFNRDGFCFAFVATDVDGIAYMESYFQNQYDQLCMGRIALRPARKFLMGRERIETIIYEIECAPAAFGMTRIAIPIPDKLQGKRQSFEVGASVHYPDGKGQRLRFRDGVLLRSNTNFKDLFGTVLAVAGAATGSIIVLSKPATARVELPIGVTENIPDNLAPEIKTLWQLGESSLEKIT